ncbi:MAG: tetratricopeptide repeat protein [Methanomethylophilus sp.]|jgi:TPR repeat protein
MTGEQPQEGPREVPPPSDPGDLYVLGGMYFQGITVPVDKPKAAALYRMSADKGNDDAMVRLGIMLMTGDGVEQDYREASKLFMRAKGRGNADAEYLLSSLYSRGKGIDYNPIEAVKLCMHSAALGCVGAMCQLGKWYRDGENYMDVDMAKAVYWLKKAAEQNYSEALYELGCMFAFGEKVQKDVENGRTLLEYADKYGDPDAKAALEALERGEERRPDDRVP